MALIVDGLCYKKILNNISLRIDSGNIVSIIGTNGSGKSKLLEIINGSEKNFEGKINCDSKVITYLVEQDLRKKFFCDTLEKEMELTLESVNYSKSKIKKRILDSFKMVGLPEYFLKRDPLTLSSSELRLADLARAFSINPDILLLDEPTIGMSEYEKKNLIQIIRKMKRRYNKTVVLVSQNLDLIHEISDYIYVLSKGSVILSGTKYEVFSKADELMKNNIGVPNIIKFENYVFKNKRVKLGFRDDINDLIKDILRNIK